MDVHDLTMFSDIVILTIPAWRGLRSAVCQERDLTVRLEDDFTFHLEWARHINQYINPFDGCSYILPSAFQRFDGDSASSNSPRVGHVQGYKVVFVSGNLSTTEVGCGGSKIGGYTVAIEKRLLSIIPKNSSEEEIIVQVDLRPRSRHWLEIRWGNADTEELIDQLEDIEPPAVETAIRFQIFFKVVPLVR